MSIAANLSFAKTWEDQFLKSFGLLISKQSKPYGNLKAQPTYFYSIPKTIPYGKLRVQQPLQSTIALLYLIKSVIIGGGIFISMLTREYCSNLVCQQLPLFLQCLHLFCDKCGQTRKRNTYIPFSYRLSIQMKMVVGR